jgi:putative heme-binding domain-containing protein
MDQAPSPGLLYVFLSHAMPKTATAIFAAARIRNQFCRRAALGLCILFASSALRAQEDDPAKDVLIVETLLRLDSFDLEAKPKTKAAVLRFLKSHPGGELFFQLLERFPISGAEDLLLDLAVAQPGETAGVKAAELLLKRDDKDRIAKTIAGEDAPRAAALVSALGNVGGKQATERLTPLVTDAAKPLAVRSAAATALGKSKTGEEYLLSLARDKKLPADLNFTVANVLFASALPEVRAEAARHLQLPASANARPVPPLAELLQMKGDGPHGKELFNGTATCNKCHTVNGQGKDVGPNLSEIGSKLSKDALLVSILDPSAGISHNFETYLAVTDDGKVISGILVSQTDDDVVLKDANAIVYTLKKAELDELKKLPTSLMPADLQKLMSAQDLVDVVEYLTTLKKP